VREGGEGRGGGKEVREGGEEDKESCVCLCRCVVKKTRQCEEGREVAQKLIRG